uniref:AP2/ERF domain-containing protein n=1 Tax=Aegilops tauschii subsp. strangulata TaxID=200361 RepID=A0A453PT43_AEGTS
VMSTSSPASGAASPEAEGGGGRKYKGVRRRKWGKWVSEIRLPNSRERIWLGSYDAPEKAARAFDAAFVCLRGPGAAGADLNFPDSPPPPCRHSVDPQEVQAAALSHANRAAVSAREAAAALMDVPSWAQHENGAMDIFGDEVAAAPDDSIDWRSVMAHQPPLFSPT